MSTLVFDRVSRWFGDTVALADVSFELTEGVTGLLGHNGAGKTTALSLCAGHAAPSQGTVRVLGRDPRSQPEVFRGLGIVPDRDSTWVFLSARETVEMLGRLRGVSNPAAAAKAALQRVALEDVADRKVGGFSQGMRQRVKLAQALVHDPRVLLLDEPLNGLDPAQRRHMVDLIVALGEEGRTVLVSSHVLAEVERMADRVLVIVNGRLVAEGVPEAIRDLLTDRPRRIRLLCTDPRALGRELFGTELVTSVQVDTTELLVETVDAGALARALPRLARDLGVTLRRVEPVGEDLESVFAYLTNAARGGGPVNLFTVGLRGLLFRPRTLALGSIPLGCALVTVIVLLAGDDSSVDDAYAGLTGLLLVPLVVAFVSLIMGVSAFSDDREDGTLLLLMATPLPRWSIVAHKLAAAWVTVLVVCAPPTVACIVLGGQSSAGWGRALTATVASVLLTSLAYTSFFLLLSLLTRRGVLLGALYIVLWEGTVAGLAASADELSIGAYGRTIVDTSIDSEALTTAADVSGATAVVVLAGVALAAAALASWRLPRSPLR